MTADVDLIGLLIAALGGAAVGLERQRSGHAEGPGARFAGIRTFTLLGGLAGLSGSLWTLGLTAPAVVLLGAAAAITAAAYIAASRHDVDGTTEIAALVVMAAGVMAGIGAYRLASGIIALTSCCWSRSRASTPWRPGSTTWGFVPVSGLPSWPSSCCRCFLRGHMGRLGACGRASCGRWSCSFPA